VKTALVIRHVAFEDLGYWGDLLTARGYAAAYREAGSDDLASISPEGPAILVVLGGPISVNDGDLFPFLKTEIDLVRSRMRQDLPTLGICLGAQVMARALGSRVFPGPAKEIGWFPLTLTPAGLDHPMRHLGGEVTSVMHWHGETFDLPEGAALLASTPICRNQAFGVGRRGLGLQFHAEVTASGLERWYIGNIGELQATRLDLSELRATAARHAPALRAQGERFFNEWLDQIET
jgi:GMP synthase (glutamine-hydrolysing)